jgi:hypothetical protein
MVWEICYWSELNIFEIKWIIFITDWFKKISHCDTEVRPSSIENLITWVKRVHSLICIGLRNGNNSGVERGLLYVKHREIGTVERRMVYPFALIASVH